MKTDIQIAQEAKIVNIMEIAKKIGLDEDSIEQYGKYKAKVDLKVLKKLENKKDGKLVLVTAITPTPAGEGKSTVTVGLTQALNKLGKSSIAALREPSLGPVFGMKGGATGGGYSQVIINIDTTFNNLLGLNILSSSLILFRFVLVLLSGSSLPPFAPDRFQIEFLRRRRILW